MQTIYLFSSWLHSSSNLDRSRFVRRDRSSPVKKNVQIFLVIVGVVFQCSRLRRAPQTTPSFKRKQITPVPGTGSTDWAWLSQIFLRCVGADQIWLRTRSILLGLI